MQNIPQIGSAIGLIVSVLFILFAVALVVREERRVRLIRAEQRRREINLGLRRLGRR
jgi:hypothetical protein